MAAAALSLIIGSVAVTGTGSASSTGTTAPSVAAPTGSGPSNKVKVSLDLKSTSNTTARFVGDVKGGPQSGMVVLQRQTSAGQWQKVATSDHTRAGFSVASAVQQGRYRVMVPLRTWYNDTRGFGERKGWRWTGPRKAYSEVEVVRASRPTDQPIKWVVGMGDSYASGEGASYAGYGPWCTGCTARGFWWINAFGSSPEETYPGDYRQPIKQQALIGREGDYSVSTDTGFLCHRSASAMMYWNNPGYAAVNFACSGATSRTKNGKPGVDFVDTRVCKDWWDVGKDECQTVVGQAKQLEEFAATVKEKGDEISVVSLSIGGNDVDFAEIVEDCATRYIMPGKYACGRTDSGSVLQKKYDDGNGLVEIVEAVYSSSANIKKALTNAGVDPESVVIDLQLPPIGLPPATQMKTSMSDSNMSTARQEVGGCGFTNYDLDFVTGPFAELMKQRFYQGARSFMKNNPGLRMVVSDTSHAFDSHQLCAQSVDWPNMEYGVNNRPTGQNTLTPEWNGSWGGANGTWMTPIIACASLSAACIANGGSMVHDYPKLMKALGCKGVDWNDPAWTAKCSNWPPYVEAQQLPMHPNYWGQRALATCHEAIATDPKAIGYVYECSPASKALDAFGRPNMSTRKVGPILSSNRSLVRSERRVAYCLNIKGGYSSGPGAAVVLWDCDPKAVNEQAYIGKDNSLRIMGRCLDAKGGIRRGATIIAYDCNGQENQRITYDATSKRLKLGDDMCVGVSQNNAYRGAEIVLWNCINEDGQKWTFDPIS